MENSKGIIDDMILSKKMALCGVSRREKHFANYLYDELTAKGYDIYPVNPNILNFKGRTCYPTLTSLPEKPDWVLMAMKPTATLEALKDVEKTGINKVWLQQGSSSKESLRFCIDNDIQVIAGKCILMYLEPVKSMHSIHRFIWKILGKY
jgi:predicted CoA-binding protein